MRFANFIHVKTNFEIQHLIFHIEYKMFKVKSLDKII